MHFREFCSTGWADYQLLDFGDQFRYEQFGAYRLIRPDPQATEKPGTAQKNWKKEAHALFTETGHQQGAWELFKPMPEQWDIALPVGNGLKMRLKRTQFKHVGLFPEQQVNWEFIFSNLRAQPGSKFLNAFAYTGAASLTAKAAGADVIHVDALRQLIDWTALNQQKSNLQDIRWVVDDALSFLKKERQRGNTYKGLVMDPPAFGRAPGGKRWQLKSQISELWENALHLLQPHGFLILNTYSQGISSILEDLFRKKHPFHLNISHGPLYLQDRFGKKLFTGWITLVERKA